MATGMPWDGGMACGGMACVGMPCMLGMPGGGKPPTIPGMPGGGSSCAMRGRFTPW